ncbi:uncharacterized protein FOMMEDRAFT_167777 [Fomitiporia mediterranea MF3/22]|uniref:uncharacterized protein n=1 Tax=Fomitiporia mediterranea (strain MF3/22) TaxID=694068 RepID=UPI00044091CB|nr:uncharacterized protein FOMMEDRAFT_167777 [Fomitiporia mediterranea MF3/22]EJD02550.1 hypothetical protein FOMMEDRAFT_167777 [Fomitiporia mediterranea MF3/22]
MTSRPSSLEPPLPLPEAGIRDDGKPQCKICSKVFKRMYALERHMIVHDPHRERFEHKCPYNGCRFSSLQKSNVKTHIAAVHEKIKHTCTLPRISDNPFDLGRETSEKCLRIFSDAPALIRHEKRAHGFYRRQARGTNAASRLDLAVTYPEPQTQFVGTQEESINAIASSSTDAMCDQKDVGRASQAEKVRCWLHTNDTQPEGGMDWEREPTRHGVPDSVEAHRSPLTYASTSNMASFSSSHLAPVSDVESSVASTLSTSPSLASELLDQHSSISTHPPSYPPANYYPCTPTAESQHSYSRVAGYQTSEVVYYDNVENPTVEPWLPQWLETRRVMQANGRYEWDGVVTSLSFFD